VALTWVQSIASYFGIWRTVNINARLAPSVGLGPVAVPSTV
jgi:hypothetical protein